MKKLLPPRLVIICLAVMFGATWLVDQPFSTGIQYLRLMGVVVAALGIFISVKAKTQFQQVHTNVDTFEQPDTLVTSGLFRFSRNPMYLGMLMLLIGIAFSLDNLIALAGPLAFLVAASFWYIPFEEKTAGEKFGEPYRTYCGQVRRWL